MVNKRGWIKIVEAFTAVLVITGALLLILGNNQTEKKDISEKIYEVEYSVLREIELNQTLRNEIMGVDNSEIPVKWHLFETQGLEEVKNKILEKIPNYLNCEANLCFLNQTCINNEYSDKDIYAKSIAIITNQENYNPRQLKLFCWVA